MNTTELPVRPDVSTFVARVRELLADLPEDERLELTEGLEADLTDQVAEHGRGVLGDPVAYTRELRAAAGLDPSARPRRGLTPGLSADDRLDAARAWWDERAGGPRLAPAWSVVAALRPVWWVARAWLATVILLRVLPGYDPDGLRWLPGEPAIPSLLVLTAAVVVSTLIGLGRWWPGGRSPAAGGTTARVVLLGLNVFAVAMLPVVHGLIQDGYWASVDDDRPHQDAWIRDSGVLNGGRQVCNIDAYDAQGQPLVGVQLFDQAGRPLDVRCFDQQATKVSWVLGDVTRWNVFPLGERDRPARTAKRRADPSDAAFPVPDRATTPAVTHPLVPVVVEEAEVDPGDVRERSGERESGEDAGKDSGRSTGEGSRKDRRR